MIQDTSNVKTLAEVVQFLTARLDSFETPQNEDQTDNSKELAEKNVIPGPGSTLGIGERRKSVSPMLDSNERSRVYAIGTLLAKAQYNFNLTKKVDKKEKTALRQPGAGATGGKGFIQDARKKTIGDKESASGGISELIDSVTGTIQDITDTVGEVKDLFDSDGKKKTKGKTRKGTRRSGSRGSRGSRGRSRGIPSRAKPRGRFGRISDAVRSVTDKVTGKGSKSPVGGSKISRAIKGTKDAVTGLGPKISNVFRGTKDAVTGLGARATTGIKSALGIAPKVTGAIKGVGGAGKAAGAVGTAGSALGSILPALGRVGSALGATGKVLGKVAAPVALAIDGVTAVTKLSTEAGRESLRSTAESLDYQKDFFGTLGKSLFSPLETASAISLATFDLVQSSRDAAKSEANLKVAEEKSREKTETYDSDKSGKIDTIEEKLKLWNSADSGPAKMKFYNDKAGKKWRYDKQTDTFTSLEGNVQMSSKDFVNRENQKNGVSSPEEVQPSSTTIAAQKTTPATPPLESPAIQDSQAPLTTQPPVVSLAPDQPKQINIVPELQPPLTTQPPKITSLAPDQPKQVDIVPGQPPKITSLAAEQTKQINIVPGQPPKITSLAAEQTKQVDIVPAQPPKIPSTLGSVRMNRATGEIVKSMPSIKSIEQDRKFAASSDSKQQDAIDLDGQNKLIVQQTQILSELLRISRMQLGATERIKPMGSSNGAGNTQVNVASPSTAGFNTGTSTSRSMYSSSPYTLSPV